MENSILMEESVKGMRDTRLNCPSAATKPKCAHFCAHRA